MQDYNIEVGDRVTYGEKGQYQVLITNNEQDFCDEVEIKKIERIGQNGWYTVYEKEKELLTEEEREFLKDIIKYYKNIYYLSFDKSNIFVREKSGRCVLAIDKPNNMFFESIENNKDYEISELGLEE